MEKPPLHNVLCEILSSLHPNCETHCYFQPPANIEMEYPCFLYNYTNDLDSFADNLHYQHSKRYTITYISHDPDSKISEKNEKYSILYI